MSVHALLGTHTNTWIGIYSAGRQRCLAESNFLVAPSPAAKMGVYKTTTTTTMKEKKGKIFSFFLIFHVPTLDRVGASSDVVPAVVFLRRNGKRRQQEQQTEEAHIGSRNERG